jgi:hypothetical protein
LGVRLPTLRQQPLTVLGERRHAGKHSPGHEIANKVMGIATGTLGSER